MKQPILKFDDDCPIKGEVIISQINWDTNGEIWCIQSYNTRMNETYSYYNYTVPKEKQGKNKFANTFGNIVGTLIFPE